MSKKPKITKATIRTNFSGKIVLDATLESLVRFVNESAELVAGAKAGNSGPVVGIRNVFTHNSKSGKPAPLGGPPGVLTGTLRRSFRTRPARRTRKHIVAVAGSDVVYARAHEFGGGPNGVPSRPYMKKGIDSARGEIEKRAARVGDRTKQTIRMKVRPIR